MKGEPRDVLDALAEELTLGLRAGFSPEQTDWAAISLRDVVLPSVWDDERSELEQIDELRAVAASVAGLDTDERWAELVTAHYASLLRPIHMASLLLGVAAHETDDEDRGWLSIEAEGIVAMVQALSEEIETFSPATLELLQDQIDAVLVDCDYVRSRGVMSAYLESALESKE